MKPTKCDECGAVLRDRPASCPLCGTAVDRQASEREVGAPQGYQARVRELHDELRRLRETEAEAV